MDEKVLLIIKNKYKLSDEVLAHLLDINFEEYKKLKNGKKTISEFEFTGTNILTKLIMLSEGIEIISSDERLRGVIDALKDDYKLTEETIILYGEISTVDFEKYYRQQEDINLEKKFDFAIKIMMLFSIVKRDFELPSQF